MKPAKAKPRPKPGKPKPVRGARGARTARPYRPKSIGVKLRVAIPAPPPEGLVGRAAVIAAKATARAANVASDIAERALKTVTKHLGAGVLREETLEQMGARMGVEAGVQVGEAGWIDSIADWLLQRVRVGVERFVKDEIVGAYNDTVKAEAEAVAAENPEVVFFKRWDATLDSKTCDECASLHDTTIEADEEFEGEGGEGPPLHPNCRCFLTVWSEPREPSDGNTNDASQAASAANAREERDDGDATG